MKVCKEKGIAEQMVALWQNPDANIRHTRVALYINKLESIVIMNKKNPFGMDLFSNFLAAYVLAFFVDSVTM